MVTWITTGMFGSEAPVGEPDVTAIALFGRLLIGMALLFASLTRK